MRGFWVGLVCFAALFALAFTARAADYAGAEVCGSCHELEYTQWKSSGHALALARLSPTQQKDCVCRSCHTSAPLSEDPALAGVQCESCHGVGGFYALRYVMKDKVLTRLLGLKDVAGDTCNACHTTDGPSVKPFVYKEQLEHVRHKPAAPAPKGR